MSSTIPTKNPRSCALVGLQFTASDAQFAAAWKKKFGESKGPFDTETSFGSPNTAKVPTSVQIESDVSPAEKERSRQIFLEEVKKHQDQGQSYDNAWLLSGMSEPGKSALAKWVRGANSEKLKKWEGPWPSGT